MLVTEPQPASPMLTLMAAWDLQGALEHHGIPADVNDGYGLAVVSVWIGLTVWCDQQVYWWRAGWRPERERIVYAWHPTIEPVRAANRVALRYADLRASHPLSGLFSGEVA